MNTKKLKEMATEEGLKTTEDKVVIEPTGEYRQTDANKAYMSNSYVKRHKLNDQRPQKRERVETEVITTDLYFKTSVAGNAVNCSIDNVRYTIPHRELSQYMEGLTNSIRLYVVQEKKQTNPEPEPEPTA